MQEFLLLKKGEKSPPCAAHWPRDAAGLGMGLGCRCGLWEVQEHGKLLYDLFLLFSSLPTSRSASPLLHLVTNISVNQALSSAANVVYRMEVLV